MGEPVDIYAARTAGQYDLKFGDGEQIQYGDQVCLVQFMKVSKYEIIEQPDGDTKKVLVFKPLEARLLSEVNLKQAVLHHLGMSSPEQGSLFDVVVHEVQSFGTEEPVAYIVEKPDDPAPVQITEDGYRRLKETELGLEFGALDGTQQAGDPEGSVVNAWDDEGQICRYNWHGQMQYWLADEWWSETAYQEEIELRNPRTPQSLPDPEPEPEPDEERERAPSRSVRPVVRPTKDKRLADFLGGR